MEMPETDQLYWTHAALSYKAGRIKAGIKDN